MLRDTVFVTKYMKTNYRLYLCGDYAHLRTFTKPSLLASNPCPSANVYRGFMSFPKIKSSKIPAFF
jgi:hypothetical protein